MVNTQAYPPVWSMIHPQTTGEKIDPIPKKTVHRPITLPAERGSKKSGAAAA